MNCTVPILLHETSGVGDARREGLSMARELGFSEEDAGRVGLVVTEAAQNAVKHARDGIVLLSSLESDGLEMLVVDKGQGIQDIPRAMADGYSTAGSPGTGMGALSRISDLLDLYSQPGQGTIVMCRFWKRNGPKAASRMLAGAVCVAAQHEEVCGDSWSLRHERDQTVLLVVDGLGHGTFAHQAAIQAVQTFQNSDGLAPAAVVHRLHGSLRGTRGASLAIATVNHSAATVSYCGLGNISGTILDPETSRSLVSHNGIVGHQLHKVNEFTYPWSGPTSTLVLHSDGLSARWTARSYPGILRHHPSLFAGALYRDCRRERDDATVVVLRETK